MCLRNWMHKRTKIDGSSVRTPNIFGASNSIVVTWFAYYSGIADILVLRMPFAVQSNPMILGGWHRKIDPCPRQTWSRGSLKPSSRHSRSSSIVSSSIHDEEEQSSVSQKTIRLRPKELPSQYLRQCRLCGSFVSGAGRVPRFCVSDLCNFTFPVLLRPHFLFLVILQLTISMIERQTCSIVCSTT